MSRNSTLTAELAYQLEFYWQLAGNTLSDEEICSKVGISFGQLRGWLQRNVKPKTLGGQRGTEGLRDIRARAKVSTMTGYLSKLVQIAEKAEANQDYAVASSNYTWLLEKQFPTVYGHLADKQTEEQLKGTTGVLDRNPVPEDQQQKQKAKEEWEHNAQGLMQQQPRPA